MKNYKKFNEKYWGLTYTDLYNMIKDEVTQDEIDNNLEWLISSLKKIQLQNKITLYRVIYVLNKEDVYGVDLGHHYVKDASDFHEEMLDYLYRNAKKKIPTLKETDCYLVEIEIETKYIDFKWTIETNCLHPFESEITLKSPKTAIIKNISLMYE